MNPLSHVRSLTGPARTLLFAGIAIIILLAALATWWTLRARYDLLFGGLQQSDAAEIVAALEEWKVPHSIVDEGTGISVPKEMVYPLRMRLVSSGVPKGGHVGFELFDDSDFGVTEFAQRVNYQRALQGEIERTISTIPGVSSVRVHLSIRKSGLFASDKEASKASVAVSMYPGHSLSRQQVRGIKNLVAAAVEGLSVDQVAIIDSSGDLLAASRGVSGLAGPSAAGDDELVVEETIQQRLSALIGHALGSDDFNVSVDVTLNMDTLRQVNDRPVGAETGKGPMISRRRINEPSAVGEGEPNAAKSEDIEYAHGSSHEEIMRAPGDIRRISVAVVLPASVGEQGLEQMRTLVIAAAGIDEVRGDQIAISRFGSSGDRHSGQDETDMAVSVDDVGTRRPPKHGIDWLAGVVGLALGLLAGTIVTLAPAGKKVRLTNAERESAMARIRGWLAEGSSSP